MKYIYVLFLVARFAEATKLQRKAAFLAFDYDFIIKGVAIPQIHSLVQTLMIYPVMS